MRVILNKDVKDIGKAGQVVEVSEGYARNYLMPRHLANEATEQALKQVEEKAKRDKAKAERLKAGVDTKCAPRLLPVPLGPVSCSHSQSCSAHISFTRNRLPCICHRCFRRTIAEELGLSDLVLEVGTQPSAVTTALPLHYLRVRDCSTAEICLEWHEPHDKRITDPSSAKPRGELQTATSPPGSAASSGRSTPR